VGTSRLHFAIRTYNPYASPFARGAPQVPAGLGGGGSHAGGAQGELLPALRTLKMAHPNCLPDSRVARDFRRTEAIQRFGPRRAYEAIARYYDGYSHLREREIFDTEKTYRLPAPPQGIHYCGYVASQGPLQPARRCGITWGSSR